jgi:phosphatidylserine/phosphatidylglycerophosphate/cardiolipin synthase-like enzyme
LQGFGAERDAHGALVARGFTGAEARRLLAAMMVRDGRAPAIRPLDATLLAAALPGTTRLVATQPEQLVPAMATLDAFRFVIAASSRELRIASPFIEHDGLGLVAPWLERAAERGVALTLLNRDPGGSSTAHLARGALTRLFGTRFRVASYHITNEGKQLLSVHAKLVIADDHAAYVGSAEIRRHSLELNFELGVLVVGEQAAALARIFDAIAELRGAPETR